MVNKLGGFSLGKYKYIEVGEENLVEHERKTSIEGKMARYRNPWWVRTSEKWKQKSLKEEI
jgi:hypothetical protein